MAPLVRIRSATIRSLLALAAVASLLGAARADVFHLKSGGRLRGQLLNVEEAPRTKFVIELDLGGEITLARDQVVKFDLESPVEREYAKLAVTVPDTLEGHERMAAWCLTKQLSAQRQIHLDRLIELDPDHAAARSALGFQKIGGKWMTRDENMAAKGYKLYKGSYHTAQEIELIEREKKEGLAEKTWLGKLKRYRGWIGTAKNDQAVKSIQTINDPYAVTALAKYLREEKYPEMRLLFAETLARMPTDVALKALVERSLVDSDTEVRITCMELAVESENRSVMTHYVAALRSKDNMQVNRAAIALRMLGNPEAIGPLIDALVTTHAFKVSAGGSPGQMSTTFSPNGGGGGMSFGNKGPQIIKRDLPNKEVLSALVTLSDGYSFEYNVKAWKQWHARQKKSQNLDARRD